MAQHYSDDGLAVLAVNAWDEPRSVVKRFVDQKNLKHIMVLGGAEVFSRQYGLKAVPTVYWIDRDGTIVDVEAGFDSPGELERRTRKLVDG